jgi:Protein of unknown function (DUF1566)
MYQITKPIWDITGATWVDHTTNPRFAVWSAGTSSQTDDVALDKETGLVWERSPFTNRMSLGVAVVDSTTRVLGRRKGWRIPAIEELLSVVDPSNTNPTLPTGHPFLNMQLDYFYWSLTLGIPVGTDNNLVWGYNFGNADTSCIVFAETTCYTWLVRRRFSYGFPI